MENNQPVDGQNPNPQPNPSMDGTPAPNPQTDGTQTPTPPQTPSVDGQNPNPDTGTGQQPTQTQLRNEEVAPAGYIPTSKFDASQKEALRLRDTLIKAGIDPNTGQPTQQAVPQQQPNQAAPLTPAQAAAQYPGFSTLTDQEKAALLDPRGFSATVSKTQQELAVFNDQADTRKQINTLAAKPENADLNLKDNQDFFDYAYQPENLNIPMDRLVQLYRLEQQANSQTPEGQTAPEGGESMSNGTKEITSQGGKEVSPENLANLRLNDPKKYTELVRSGKLKISDT